MTASTCVANFINGNLAEAKEAAKRIPEIALFDAAIQVGKTHHTARAIANYLKRPSRESWQAACIADQARRAAP